MATLTRREGLAAIGSAVTAVTLGANASQHYNDIYGLVPMNTSQDRLAELIATYKDDHGETFNEQTDGQAGLIAARDRGRDVNEKNPHRSRSTDAQELLRAALQRQRDCIH